MNYIAVMLSPEATATDLAAAAEPSSRGVVSPTRSPAFADLRARHRERLGQIRSRLRGHIEETLPLLTPSPPAAAELPATPHVARLLDFSAKLHQVPDGATAGDIRQLLLSRPPRPPAERTSLRLSFNPECIQLMQRSGEEGVQGASASGNSFMGDTNAGEAQERVVLEDSDAPFISFHLKCTSCASDERILIDANASSLFYCPFCGVPQR
ncbi:uncharacterized protein Tco025E_06809 [Trypanosoma conorhini]|uniref:Uncharacterized protein n=1 Tax=Trypanosoma conorhini TaxID=83891 RepID=A0A422NXY0_9TRYP|nr:uncharacterized protein Tco025E_06809 [Trypanosoma conorhini]RNF10363.1 hypothetical protein Tco025E_06809 [Trypanosoma conorhini]